MNPLSKESKYAKALPKLNLGLRDNLFFINSIDSSISKWTLKHFKKIFLVSFEK